VACPQLWVGMSGNFENLILGPQGPQIVAQGFSPGEMDAKKMHSEAPQGATEILAFCRPLRGFRVNGDGVPRAEALGYCLTPSREGSKASRATTLKPQFRDRLSGGWACPQCIPTRAVGTTPNLDRKRKSGDRV
jgi:hypothetical protein